MRYNTELKKLIIPEYGRHIHEIIDNLCEIKDEKKRNEQAEITIQIMGNLNPHLRDVADFKHKLWDHLFIMSEYKLDVKSPYPKPKEGEGNEKQPEMIQNRQGSVKYPHYGSFIISMIHEVGKMEDGKKKTDLAIGIANQMKKTYINWNQSNIMDKFILNELKNISKEKIILDTNTTLSSYSISKPINNSNRKKSHTYSRSKKYSN